MLKRLNPFKFVLTIIVVAVLVITSTLSLHSFTSSESGKGELFFTNTSNVDPNFDPKVALGDEVLGKLSNASPNAIVSHDPITGETTVTERGASFGSSDETNPSGFGNGETLIYDTSNADLTFDPKAALGEEVLEKLKNASPDAIVSRDPNTGETIVTEREAITSEPLSTEPYFPDNGEIAPPPSELIGPEAIIGDDNRRQITNVNTYPYRAITLLEVTYENGATAFGSGAFVSDTAILTAGHVIYSQKHGWANSVKVIPGGTGSNQSTATTSDVVSVNGWVRDGDWDYDYGIVRIARSLGTGHFGTRSLSNSNLSNKAIYNYGYPSDKTYGTLWYDTGTTGTLWTRRFLHNADTMPGNSGGPVVLQSDYEYIVGVHSDAYNSNYNIATRVTNEVVDFVKRNTEW